MSEPRCESAVRPASSTDSAGDSVSNSGSGVFRYLRRLSRDFLAAVLFSSVDCGAGGLIGRWAGVLTDVEGCLFFFA